MDVGTLMRMESAGDGWLLTLGGMNGRPSVFSSLSCSLLWVIQDFMSEMQSGVAAIICRRSDI